MPTPSSHRERKKERTRQALVDAAVTLFGTKGYEETTIAELAAAADIAPRTFFSYFASKEEVLFEGTPLKLEIAGQAFGERRPEEGPADLLLRVFRTVLSADTDLVGQPQQLRVELIARTPSLQAYALRRVLEGQQHLARGLLAAFPGELDEVEAAALSGALVGTIVSTLGALLADPERAAELIAHPDRLREALDHAIESTRHHFGVAGGARQR